MGNDEIQVELQVVLVFSSFQYKRIVIGTNCHQRDLKLPVQTSLLDDQLINHIMCKEVSHLTYDAKPFESSRKGLI